MVHDLSDAQRHPRSADVLPFRLRHSAGHSSVVRGSDRADADGALQDDLAQYEDEDRNETHRHRMLMNVIALAVVALLVGAGVWIADTITEMERDQDCVLQGRQNCAPIQVPPSTQK